jgi:hypothetical protein
MYEEKAHAVLRVAGGGGGKGRRRGGRWNERRKKAEKTFKAE